MCYNTVVYWFTAAVKTGVGNVQLLEVLSAVARGMIGSIFTDAKMLSVYALVALVIITAYRKYLGLKEDLGIDYGKSKWRLLEESILTGLVSGFILSVICLFLGITINIETIDYFIFLVILLAVINIRFVSFVYVGGGLIIINTIARNLGIDSLSLLILTGLVQLTEAILIYLLGKTDAVPVYIKMGDRIAGAFVMRKIWPVPIVFFIYSMNEILAIFQSGQRLEWWTLLKPSAVIPAVAVLGLDCLIAIIGYWDIAVVEKPELKCKKASFYLAGIAAFLLLVSPAAYKSPVVASIAALIAIAAREGLVIWGKRAQKFGEPLFASVDRGLRLLDVTAGGNADKLGLEKGDIILSVNGKDIQTIEGLKAVLDEYPRYLWIIAQKTDGSRKIYEKSFYPYGIDSLGVLTVPRESEVTYNMDSFENLVILRDLVKRFRGMGRSMKD